MPLMRHLDGVGAADWAGLHPAGGMSEEESTLNLQALQDEVKRLGVQTPWRLTFSYGRALQSATLKVGRHSSKPQTP